MKYAPNASLTLAGSPVSVKWRGASYRPVVFTAKDDNTVGETISGSSGNPTFGAYAASALHFNDAAGVSLTLTNFRIAYAQQAISYKYQGHTFAHGQFVDCAKGIAFSYGNATLRNVLFANVQYAFNGLQYAGVYAENVTFGGMVNYPTTPAYLGTSAGGNSPYGVTLKNCILARLTTFAQGNASQTGDHNGFWKNTYLAFGSSPVTCPTEQELFQSAGAGNYYLADTDPPFRDAGTTAINSGLALALQRKTTWLPQVLESSITANTVLSPGMVLRDTNEPDLGYHYEPLDWVVNAKGVSAVLTLSGGVAIGTYGAASSYGLGITDTGSLVSEGTPANLNWIVRYNTVQEQSLSAWSSSTVGTSVRQDSSAATVAAEFTGWSLLAGVGEHFNDSVAGTASVFQDCQFGGGRFTIFASPASLFNCLWERVAVDIEDDHEVMAFSAFNNLMVGGSLSLTVDKLANNWILKDNFFERTTITSQGNGTITHDYNGYITGQSRLLPSPAPNDVPPVANMVYATGPRGNFYQAQTDLRNEGSRTAAAAELTDYTTQADFALDTGDVDIGFHYWVGHCPEAYGSNEATCRNEPKHITLSGGDSDGDLLTYTVVSGPTYGTLSPPSGTGQHRTYTPMQDDERTDIFSYKVNDGSCDSDEATVTIEVGIRPTADDFKLMVHKNDAGEPVTLTGSDGCDDPHEPLAFTVLNSPADPENGTLTGTAPNLTYQPDANFIGEDSFQFMVNDGFRDSGNATVTIFVVPGPYLSGECRQDRIILTWDVSVIEQEFWPEFIHGFKVYRSETSGSYGNPIATLDAVVHVFSDETVTQGNTYYYVVTFLHSEPDPQNPVATYESPVSNEIEIETCPRPPGQPTDIVFIMDNTFSASGPGGGKLGILKDGVIAALDEIVAASTVNSVPNYRMALVTPDNDQVHVRLNSSEENRDDCEDEVELLAELPEPRGNWFPESTDECIKTAVTRRADSQVIPPDYCTRPPPPPEGPDPEDLQIGDFTEAFVKARKLIVLITDAPPGGFCDPESFLQVPHGNWARDIARNAYTNGIRINAIQVPDEADALDNDTLSLLEDYRDITCGWYSQIPISLMDATSVKEAILRMFYVPAACE